MATTDKQPTNQVIHLLLCDHFTQDNSGKASYIGIFDEMNFPEIPASIPRFFLVARIAGVTGDNFRLTLQMPGGNPTTVAVIPVNKEAKKLHTANLALQIENMDFRVSGNYVFTLYADEDTVGEFVMPVNIRMKAKDASIPSGQS